MHLNKYNRESTDCAWGGGGYSVLCVKSRQGAVKANGPGPAFSRSPTLLPP